MTLADIQLILKLSFYRLAVLAGSLQKNQRKDMRLFKKLKAYNQQEIEGAYFGFGILRAKDYDRDIYGHLFLFSMNTKVKKFIKKLFIAI